MAQTRTFEFKADDSTFDLNNRNLELTQPGLYHGFDPALNTGLSLELNHNTTGVATVTENLLYTNKKGLYITKQGVIIKESDAINIPIDIGGSQPRIDLVVAEHAYEQITGGQQAIYIIIKGTPGTNPVAPVLTNEKKQLILGQLYVPANMSSLDSTGVVYTKAIQPDYAGNGFRARIEAQEDRNDGVDVGILASAKKASNLSDLTSASSARSNLELGNHVTHNYIGSGGNYGTSNSIARGNHVHSGVYEPVFTKNNAFNKNFGTGSGTVTQGNDSRLSNSRKCNNTFDDESSSRSALKLGDHVTHNYNGYGGTNNGTSNTVARGDHTHSASGITTGTFAVGLIPSMSYQKLTSGYVNAYANIRLQGYRLTYAGAANTGIYLSSTGTAAIGNSTGTADTMLTVWGSARFRDNDVVAGNTETGVAHRFEGRGKFGDYPHILNVAQSDDTPQVTSNAIGINVQMSYYSNSIAGSYKHITFMNRYGGYDGYIGNSSGSIRGVEFWGLQDTHQPSDRRLKTDIKPASSVLERLKKAQVVSFKYKDDETLKTGFIAQDLAEEFPEWVDNTEEYNKSIGAKEGDNNYRYWSVKPMQMIPVLVKAIQELKEEINQLKNQ